MNNSKLQEAIDNKLNTICYLIPKYKGRLYQQEEISALLWDSIQLWSENSNDNRDEITERLYDIYDNLGAYLGYYTGNAVESLDFLVNTIEGIQSSIENRLNDRYSGESTDYDSDSESDSDSDIGDNIGVSDNESDDEFKYKYKIGHHFNGYESDIDAKEREWKSALKAEQRFFNISRNKKDSTHTLYTQFFNNRRNKTTTLINSDGHSARALITADSAAVQKSFPEDKTIEIKTDKDIVTHLKWRQKKRRDWNREKVKRGNNITSYQFQPAPGNLGNIKVDGVGRYGLGGKEGKTPNILEVINALTGSDPILEQKFAKILLEYSRNKIQITEKMLYAKGFALYTNKRFRDQHINQLNKLAYLICIKETSRRKFQGSQNIRHGLTETPELPFGVAIAKALRLLADGHLRMIDVFDEDASYGVFTGKEIMHEKNISKTKNKFQKLFNLYNHIYANRCEIKEGNFIYERALGKEFLASHPNAKITSSCERDHQDLSFALGGDSESSGEEYSSASEDENFIKLKL